VGVPRLPLRLPHPVTPARPISLYLPIIDEPPRSSEDRSDSMRWCGERSGF
jgi:hypothetical protein